MGNKAGVAAQSKHVKFQVSQTTIQVSSEVMLIEY